VRVYYSSIYFCNRISLLCIRAPDSEHVFEIMSVNMDSRLLGVLGKTTGGDLSAGGMQSGSGSGIPVRNDGIQDSVWLKIAPVGAAIETDSEIRFEHTVPDGGSIVFPGESWFDLDIRPTCLDMASALSS
jgi:hypothetical protein